MVRIGIVNHQTDEIVNLTSIIDSSDAHEVVWIAHDLEEAIAQCSRGTVDLILLDLLLPDLTPVTIKQILQDVDCPVLLVTNSLEENSNLIYEAMDYGAIDVITNPYIQTDTEIDGRQLLEKMDRISVISGKDCRRMVSYEEPEEDNLLPPTAPAMFPPVLAIGASTGGPQALTTILQRLPTSFPAAIFIVQHVEASFLEGFAEWLKMRSPLPVTIAQKHQHPLPGHVYLAGAQGHLIVDSVGRLDYDCEPDKRVHRPAIDVLFQSLREHWRRPGCAVLLTGMGRDGATGLKELKQGGWYTIVQNQESSIVYGMPKAAVQNQAARIILPIKEIAKVIRQYFN